MTKSSPSRRQDTRLVSQRRLLMAGASVFVLLLATNPVRAGVLSNAIANPTTSSGTTSATSSATAAATAASQAATATAKVTTDLASSAKTLRSALAAQAAARAIGSTSAVTDGLSSNGLVVDPRVTFDNSGASTTSGLWDNISAPSQTTSNGQTTVTLTQTSQNAIATWYKFNVGKNTTLYFDQSAGTTSNGNNWVVLNRIDATGSPSQILGSIKAQGTVLVINPNGIIFGAGSQVNVHSLIASAMDINGTYGVYDSTGNYTAQSGTVKDADGNDITATFYAPSNEASGNSYFLKNGLFDNTYTTTSGATNVTHYVASLAVDSGKDTNGNDLSSTALKNYGVTVEKGATISTLDYVSGYDNGGLVALVGPSVSNAGLIETSAGQIILASGAKVYLTEPDTSNSGTAFSASTLISANNNSGFTTYDPSSSRITVSGISTNEAGGVLSSQRGDITLVGTDVAQDGLAQATTSITRPGSITITASDTVTFGADSVTSIIAAENGETITESSIATGFTAPTITILTTNMDMESGSLIVAPSATMTVNNYAGANNTSGTALDPSGRVLLESGSIIDLGGMAATASVSDYLYTFKVTANDVADTPEAKSLIGQTVTIDLRLSGTRSDGEKWVGSPLFAATGAGYLGNVSYGIDQLLTGGGSLKIGSTAAFTDVLTAKGSTVNVSGGAITYGSATVSTTNVLTASGAVVNIGSADPFVSYSGLPGTITVTHTRAGTSETYTNKLAGGTTSSYTDYGYTDGISAGAVSVAAVNPILQGTIVGTTVTGSRQASLSVTSASASAATPDDLPTGASLTITLGTASSGGTFNSVVLADDAETSAAMADVLTGVTLDSGSLSLPTVNGLPTITYSTDLLSSENLGSITIKGAYELSMTAGSSLSVRAGGSITLANVTEIDGSLTAHGGKITLSGLVPSTNNSTPATSAAVTIGGLLDVSGLWVNDAGLDATTMQGWAWIDGGSVSITTNKNSSGTQDTTQSIVLASGSVIDLSSGGYVTTAGKLKTGSDGLPSGNGGSLTLQTYVGDWHTNDTPSGSFPTYPLAPATATNATVVLDGTIYAGGLNQGGTLTLQVPAISIDGTATTISTDAATGTLILPTSFFTQGFSSYKLTSAYGDVTVTDNTTLALKQQNYLISADTTLPATGTSVRDFASLGYAVDGERQPVNLTLTQQAFGAFGGYQSAAATDPENPAGITIGAGASIIGDPGAAITLTAAGPVTVLGSIVAHGGSITLSSDDTSLSHAAQYTAAQDVWIGADALLDVSGTYVPDPTKTSYSTGEVLDGGAITLSSSGAIVVLDGATLDISGASATIQQPSGGSSLSSSGYTTKQIWSDGGTLSLAGTAAYFAGTIDAAGGSSSASGGTLNVTMGVTGNSGTILIAQSGDVTSGLASASAPATAAQLAALGLTSGTGYITADTINAAHLDSASLTGTTIAFSGNVAITVPDALYLNGNIALSSGAATTVDLSAGYIRWLSGAVAVPDAGSGTLNLNASAQIDLAGVVSASYADAVNLSVSGGDIRFLPTSESDISSILAGITYGKSGDSAYSVSNGVQPSAGALIVSGDLTMTAREIYPATDTAFLLMSTGTGGTNGGTISFRSNGQSTYTPYSAGGAILVDAATITQAGALIAPLGTIQLGYSADQSLPAFLIGSIADTATGNVYDPVTLTGGTSPVLTGVFDRILAALQMATGSSTATVTTDSVTLASGSLTSTSANGVSVPYGATTDGETWTTSGTQISGPPAKLIVVAGNSVTTASGATIDESGGGDVYASEFVAGTGGSRNVLTTSNTYALVPSYEAKVAAYDTTSGGTVALGTAVTLSGGNGIAAGTYVLMPASYATLSGAYRVVVVSTNTGSSANYSSVAADGSVYMTGTLTNAVTGAKSSSTALFELQSGSVWRQYSEIDTTSGNSYFSGTTARLARDAGQLVVAATNGLTLAATNKFIAATGGRGGEIDITGNNLLIAASDLKASLLASGNYSNFIVLDADQISGLGVESVLLGGYRATTASGVKVTTTAESLEVATDAAHALSGPEILLAANDQGAGLTVDQGSVIKAVGKVSSASSDALILAGDGAFVRVSNGGAITVTRSNATANDGLLSIDAASLSGASITLDSSGDVTLSAAASLAAQNYDLGARIINIGGGNGGLVLSSAVVDSMAGAAAVSLRGLQGITFYGDVALGSAADPIGSLTLDAPGLISDGGTANATVTASNITLKNSSATSLTASAGTGRLTLDATGILTFGVGAKATQGFSSLNATAGKEILFSGSGSLSAGSAAVTLTAPFLVVDTSASQSLTTSGIITVLPVTGGTLSLAGTVYGGSLTLTGGSIVDSGTIVAQSGKVTLEATSGDIDLEGSAAILAKGTTVALSDQLEYTPGGTVKLIADTGNITLGGGTTIDVSASGSGYAGAIGIQADSGTVTLGGTLNGAASTNALGGSFVLSANALSGSLPISSGFTTEFEVALTTGDITIASGQTLTAATVLLEADGGQVTVNGTIDASGSTGGTIQLFGTSGVDVEGSLLAKATTKGNSGGTVEIGTSGVFDPANGYNATSGYENLTSSGQIKIGSAAVINVSGLDSSGHASDTGTLLIRAPLLADGSVNVIVANGAVITGAKTKALEAYAVWSTTDGTTGAQHFDAIVDPAGWYSSNGTLLAGGFTDGSGTPVASWDGTSLTAPSTLTSTGTTTSNIASGHYDGTKTTTAYQWDGATLTTTVTATTNSGGTVTSVTTTTTTVTASGTTKTTVTTDGSGTVTANTTDTTAGDTTAYNTAVETYLLTNYYFTPSNTNSDHQTFYGYVNGTEASGAGTLMGFVQSGLSGSAAQITATHAGLTLTPGIELRNPSATINSGNITVATNWNLGAKNASGDLVYRYGGSSGVAPILTLRAKNNVDVNASITDGFTESTAVGTITTISGNSYGSSSDSTTAYGAYYNYNSSLADTLSSLETTLTTNGVSYSVSDLTITAPAVYSSLNAAYSSSSLDYYYYLYSGYEHSYAYMYNAYVSDLSSGVNNGKITASGSSSAYAYRTLLSDYTCYNGGSCSYTTIGGATGTLSTATGYGVYKSYSAYTNYLKLSTDYDAIYSATTASAKLSAYKTYLDDYSSYISSWNTWANSREKKSTSGYVSFYITEVPVAPLAFPSTVLASVAGGTVYSATVDNSPSPTTSSKNYSPISSMDLASEASSSSYRIVAGADFASANPLAVDRGSSANVVVDGHISYTDPQTIAVNNAATNPTISVGTVVRTGTGSIEIAASGDFVLADAVAPGAVYTAGTAADISSLDFTAPAVSTSATSNGLVSTPTWASGGGSVTVSVLGDILGVETYSLDGATNWSEWYYHASKSSGTTTAFDSTVSNLQQSAAWVNYATYADGIGALGGGNVTLKAGGTIKDIIVSLPQGIIVAGGTSSSSPATEYTYGGGNLSVTAANIVGSAFLVGQGSGTIRVSGSITKDSAGNALELAVQDGYITVIAGGDITLGGIYDPAMLANGPDTAYTQQAALPGYYVDSYGKSTLGSTSSGYFTSYSDDSGISLTSASGNVTVDKTALGNALLPSALEGYSGANSVILAPASLVIDAIGGDITINATVYLIPSSSGTLTLLAGGDITSQSYNATGPSYGITMLDGTSSLYVDPLGTTTPITLSGALHADDDGSVLIYAGEDITGSYSVIKQAKVDAGRDIINTAFSGQNNRATDITSIIAGRDIGIKVTGTNSSGNAVSGITTFLLYGPGDLLIQAGRNLGPFGGGIYSVGDGSNCTTEVCGGVVKSYLPVDGANITTLFGVGSGVDYASAISDYVTTTTGGISFISSIASQLETTLDGLLSRGTSSAAAVTELQNLLASWGLDPLPSWALTSSGLIQSQYAGTFTLNQASVLSIFQTKLSTARQELLVDRAFLDFLTQVSADYSNSASAYYQQYGRAYTAIATLFPASLGYTNNDTGNSNSVSATVKTGTMSMAHSLVETQTGGDINIIGPGGSLWVGSNSDDTLSPAQEGILTLQGGSINGYTDGSVMIYQSRIFTEQGGDVNLFSANGDLNAGKGKKSKTAYPKLTLICDTGGYCRVSPAGLVSGAGIGALVTIPGQDASKSNASLTTPHGTVDAGAAGIRTAGNLTIVAKYVLNAFNISVGGTATGVPQAVAPTVNLGALAASDAAGSSASAADAAARSSRQTGARTSDMPSIITVEVIGYGGAGSDEAPQEQQPRRRGYNPNSAVQFNDGEAQ